MKKDGQSEGWRSRSPSALGPKSQSSRPYAFYLPTADTLEPQWGSEPEEGEMDQEPQGHEQQRQATTSTSVTSLRDWAVGWRQLFCAPTLEPWTWHTPTPGSANTRRQSSGPSPAHLAPAYMLPGPAPFPPPGTNHHTQDPSSRPGKRGTPAQTHTDFSLTLSFQSGQVQPLFPQQAKYPDLYQSALCSKT